MLYDYDYTCVDCGKEMATQVHHLKYDNLDTDEEYGDCIPLCALCHKKRHN